MIKKPTEFAINSYASMMTAAQFDDLSFVEGQGIYNENNPCHIYMICRRPRIQLDIDAFECKGESLNMGFKIQNQDKFDELELEFTNPFGKKEVKIETQYPYNIFNFIVEDKKVKAKTAAFLQAFPRQKFQGDFLDLEVMYVGQSYGKEGARTAPERLKKHETLQAIYAEALNKNPDKEIWLMLFSFSQMGITMFDGRSEFTDKERKDDSERTSKFINTIIDGGITEQQFINFTEAALIRYFKPPYNKDYINTFPNPAHKTYGECYDLDVNSVTVELGTMDSINIMLYSNEVDKQMTHFGQFVLHNKEQRVDMFDFSKL